MFLIEIIEFMFQEISCVQRGVGGGHAFQSSVLVPQNFQAHEPLDRILG